MDVESVDANQPCMRPATPPAGLGRPGRGRPGLGYLVVGRPGIRHGTANRASRGRVTTALQDDAIRIEELTQLADDSLLQRRQVDAGLGEDVRQPFPATGERQLPPLPDFGGPRCEELLLVQALPPRPQPGERPVEFEQSLDLRVQDVAGHRFDQEVDRAQVVAALEFVARRGIAGQEAMIGVDASSLFHGSTGRFRKTVQPRQVDVEDDHRDLVLEEFGEGVLAGTRRDDRAVQREQHGAQQVAQPGIVIDQEDCLGALVCLGFRATPSFSSGSSCSGCIASETKTPTLAHFVPTGTRPRRRYLRF